MDAVVVADVRTVGRHEQQARVTGLEGVAEAVHERRIALEDGPLGDHHGGGTRREVRPQLAEPAQRELVAS